MTQGEGHGRDDIHRELVALRRRAAASEDRFRLIVERSTDGVIVVTTSGEVLFSNRTAEKMLGSPGGSVLEQIRAFPVAGDGADLQLAGPDGSVKYEAVRAFETEWDGERATLFLLRDTSERHELEARLRYLASHDVLTGLRNRFELHDQMTVNAARIRRHGDAVAVVYADIDDLKSINDSYGHAVGDQVLMETARRILGAIRPSDTAARVGGDEFVVVCEVPYLATGDAIAARIADAINRPVLVGGSTIALRATVGAVVDRDAAPDLEPLIAAADAAMYQLKP